MSLYTCAHIAHTPHSLSDGFTKSGRPITKDWAVPRAGPQMGQVGEGMKRAGTASSG